jgi:membrane protein CcdC involved in cytochrome C biogenesis
VRLGLRQYISSIISVQQTAGLFFVLAFGMIVRWRATLLLEYRQLTNHSPPTSYRSRARAALSEFAIA